MSSNTPMEAIALLQYMETCAKGVQCSVSLIDKEIQGREGLRAVELKWQLSGMTIAKLFTAGHLHRDNKELQRVFNSVRAMFKSINQG